MSSPVAAAVPASSTPTGGWRWPPMLAVAGITFLEFWRRWFLLGLLVVGLLPGLLATFLPVDTQRGAERVELIILWGLGGVAFGGALGASVMAALQTPMEIEDRRIYGLVCRPIRRWRLLVGKMGGIAGLLGVYAALAYVALSAMIGLRLAGETDAPAYLITRRSQAAVMLGFNLDPRHIVVVGNSPQVDLHFDFTTVEAAEDWGRAPKERYHWLLVTAVRSQDGRPQAERVWSETKPAFTVTIGGEKLPQFEQTRDQVARHDDWFLERSGHVILIVPESWMRNQSAADVTLRFVLNPDYFQPGDVLFFSDLAVYDKPNPPYDERLDRKIPFVQTILSVGEGQHVAYLLTPPPGTAAAVQDQFIGLHLKSATMFRDIFSLQAGLLRFDPVTSGLAVERERVWVVQEKKITWAGLVEQPGQADPVKYPSFGPAPTTAPAVGWPVLRLTGLPAVVGQPTSGALFQLESQGDIRMAAVRSNLWVNLAVGLGLFFLQWLCLVILIVAWSGNLSLGVSVLCALILAVACYGSGSARNILTEEKISFDYRMQMLATHPELQAEPIADWQYALNTVMYWIVWTPPDFMDYSPTERVKSQTDIPLSDLSDAALNLLLYRAFPLALVGLLIFERREF